PNRKGLGFSCYNLTKNRTRGRLEELVSAARLALTSPGPTFAQAQSYYAQKHEHVTSEKLCRAQHELHFQAATYLCLLRSIRQHVALHQEFHGKGERSVEESAGLVGLQLPRQPGGKGWEP
uniref:Protein FMC1 homolog n=1 Tax=Mus spicilegus TaxID=10103 RepID=A0A8C6GEW3_MUSSI